MGTFYSHLSLSNRIYTSFHNVNRYFKLFFLETPRGLKPPTVSFFFVDFSNSPFLSLTNPLFSVVSNSFPHYVSKIPL